jgi:uncharacterized protein (DUF1501 family)
MLRKNMLKTYTQSYSLPAWMPRLSFAPANQAPRGDVLVVIFLRGAMDGLNALVPVGDSDYYRNRKAIAIAQPKTGDDKSAIALDSFFGLHPALRSLKPVWDDGMLAPIHACGSPDPTRSHFDAMDTMERGTPGQKSLGSGWLGRHLTSLQNGNTSPLRAVGMGTMLQASLRGPVSATVLKSIADFHLKGRDAAQVTQLQQTLSALYAGGQPGVDDALRSAAGDIESTIGLLQKVNATKYVPANGAQYPQGDFGLGMMQVAQLIKAEVGLEVAAIDFGGWDTHINQGGAEGQMARLLKELGDALGAFHADLRDRMKQITVTTMSEFGRRVEENAAGGTDHGHANCMFVMGGNVAGGKVHGVWPGLTKDKLDRGDLALTTDYRNVLGEILTKRVGNPRMNDVFPGFNFAFQGIVKSI